MTHFINLINNTQFCTVYYKYSNCKMADLYDKSDLELIKKRLIIEAFVLNVF